MKKVVKKILLLIICFIILEFIFYIFKTKHNIEYKLNIDDKNYVINEIYKNSKYYIEIKLDNISYSYYLDNIYHKDKKIIKDIKYYEKDDLKCIYPVLDNSYIECFYNDKLYSGNYFIDSLEDFNYLDTYSTKTKNLGYSKVYYENIDNNYLYVYKYNGVYSINKKLEEVDMFLNDNYNNELATIIDKYYITFNYDDKYEYNSIFIYNVTNNRKKEIKLDKTISKNTYINGVVDNKLYIFDIDNLVQYEINPRNKKIKEVGNKKDGALYYDEFFSTLDIYEFKKDKLLFNNSEYSFYKKDGNISYYLDDSNNFIMYNSVTNKEIILFNKNISNISVIDNNIYFVSDNTVYSYNIKGTYVPLVSYDELRFNPLNRVFVYRK